MDCKKVFCKASKDATNYNNTGRESLDAIFGGGKLGVIPQLIDNKRVTDYTLGNVLEDLLTGMEAPEFCVATAYFNLGGWMRLAEGLKSMGRVRMLLGKEHKQSFIVSERLREELQLRVIQEGASSIREIAEWERHLRSPEVEVRIYRKGFLHGKCYIVLGGIGQDTGIVGSSNFTSAGLETNLELNAVIRDEFPLRHLQSWFESLWEESEDYKEELLSLIYDFTREYSPHDLYIKVIYEAYKDMFQIDIAEEEGKPSPIALADFQNDGYRIAHNILRRYGGVLISDSVGLGKTYIALALLDEFVYRNRQTALVICPAALQEILWKKYLETHSISHRPLSMEQLSRLKEHDLWEYAEYPVIVVDESHNFRNPSTKRWSNLLRILQIAEQHGRNPLLILLTATPVNNSVYDLLHQLQLISRDNSSFLSDIGIENIEGYFRMADKEKEALYDVLEAIAVRRTRNFIRRHYPDAKIDGKPLKFPKRILRSINYQLEQTYGRGLYRRIAQAIEELCLAPYQVDVYSRDVTESSRIALQRELFDTEHHSTLVERLMRKGFSKEAAHDMALRIGRQTAIAHILRVLYLKRLESSVEALRISLNRQLQFQRSFLHALEKGYILKAEDYRRVISFFDADEPENLTHLEEAFKELPISKDYDVEGLKRAVQVDIATLEELLSDLQSVGPTEDEKMRTLQNILKDELCGSKAVVFTQFKDTARYLHKYLGGNRMWLEHHASPDDRRLVEDFLKQAGEPTVSIIDSDVEKRDRTERIRRFAPVSNNCREQVPKEREIRILISTDVLSEGQNLQDAPSIINYDLHWNPIRLVQRIGRIDRIGCLHDEISVYNFIPEDSLEELLGLLRRLREKLDAINRTVGLDTSVLGEPPDPKDFNAILKIAEEDTGILDDLEKEVEIVIADFIQNDLMEFLQKKGEEYLRKIPLGVGCAKKSPRGKGFFVAFRTKSGDSFKHYWALKDLSTGKVLYNKARAIAPIRSAPDEKPIPLPDEINPDELINAIRNEMVRYLNRLSHGQKDLKDPQKTIVKWLQTLADSETKSYLLSNLSEPLGSHTLKRLRNLWNRIKKQPDDKILEALVSFTKKLSSTSQRQRTRTYSQEDFECVAWVALL